MFRVEGFFFWKSFYYYILANSDEEKPIVILSERKKEREGGRERKNAREYTVIANTTHFQPMLLYAVYLTLIAKGISAPEYSLNGSVPAH
jgi:hypothetical protein